MNGKQEDQEQRATGLRKPLLDQELNVVNIGLEIFYNALKHQGIEVIDVAWSPPAKLDAESESILDKIL